MSSPNRTSHDNVIEDLQTYENNDQVISYLNQQFDKLVDSEVIESVAYECDYNVEKSSQVLREISSSVIEGSASTATPSDAGANTRNQMLLDSPTPPPAKRDRNTMVPATPADRAIQDVRRGHLVLILMRGLPGSGKSSLARSIVSEAIGPCNPREFILSTDDFFSLSGAYQYNSAFIGEAHAWNQKRAFDAIQRGSSPIIIDNTNSQLWEMKPYACWAVENGYIVHVVEPTTSWAFKAGQLARRNTHGVSVEKIRDMLDRYQRDITTEMLFQAFGLRYREELQPPLTRSYPPLIRAAPPTVMAPKMVTTTWTPRPKSSQESLAMSPGAERVARTSDMGTSTRCDGSPTSCERMLPARNRFVNNGELPPKYPKEGRFDRSTQCDETVEDVVKQTQETAIDHLQSIFEGVPRDYLKEILEKCSGDVQWSIDILLDDNRELIPNYEPPATTQTTSVVPPDASEVPTEIPGTCTSQTSRKQHQEPLSVEEGIALKKHLESNVVIGMEHYSEHIRKLKGSHGDSTDALAVGSSPAPGAETSKAKTRDSTSEGFIFINSDDDDDDELVELSDDSSDGDDVVELNLGDAFVAQLRKHFADPAMQVPAGYPPVVEIPKSLGRQLYALYVESVYTQMENEDAVLQRVMEQDARYARDLQEEEVRQSEAAILEREPPDLRQIMRDQQEAQRNARAAESEWRNLTPDDLAARLTRQKLVACFPDVGEGTLEELLAAHANDYEETVSSLRASGVRYVDDAGAKRTLSARTLEEMRAALDEVAADDVDDEEDVEEASEDLREQAFAVRRRRNELQEKAKQYFGRGLPEVGAFYSELARKQAQLLERYNQMAAVRIVSEGLERVNAMHTIDLHYLHVNEAINVLDIFLDEVIVKMRAENTNMHMIQVITGRGKNSINGIPRIKPRVVQRLKKRNIKYHWLNPGLVELKLMKNTLITTECSKK